MKKSLFLFILLLCFSKTLFSEYKIYFANLRSHSETGDDSGEGSLSEAYYYAKNSSDLDIFAVTPDTNSFKELFFNDLKNVSEYFHEEKRFLAFFGLDVGEKTLDRYFTIYNSNNFYNLPLNFKDEVLLDWLSSNHIKFVTFNQGISEDFYSNYKTIYKNYIKGFELITGPSSGDYDDESGKAKVDYKTYFKLLNLGYKVGPIANQDNKKKFWGKTTAARTGILSENLTDLEIHDALAKLRFYATEDKSIKLKFKVIKGAVETAPDFEFYQGSTVYDVNDISFEVEAQDLENSITKVELYGDQVGGDVAKKVDSRSHPPYRFQVSTEFGFSYYFVKVTSGIGKTAYSSPIWINKEAVADQVAPIVYMPNIFENLSYSGVIDVDLAIEEESSSFEVFLYLDNQVVYNEITSDKNLKIKLNTSLFTNGNHELRVLVIDRNGNFNNAIKVVKFVNNNISGKVIDYSNGLPIENALVRVVLSTSTLEVYTDSDGKFVVNDIFSKERYDVFVQKEQYYTAYTSSGDFENNNNTVTILKILNYGSLTGQIVDKNENLLANVKVKGTYNISGTNTYFFTKSDSSGIFKFSNIPSGTISLDFTLDGYISILARPVTVMINEDNKIAENIVMNNKYDIELMHNPVLKNQYLNVIVKDKSKLENSMKVTMVQNNWVPITIDIHKVPIAGKSYNLFGGSYSIKENHYGNIIVSINDKEYEKTFNYQQIRANLKQSIAFSKKSLEFQSDKDNTIIISENIVEIQKNGFDILDDMSYSLKFSTNSRLNINNIKKEEFLPHYIKANKFMIIDSKEIENLDSMEILYIKDYNEPEIKLINKIVENDNNCFYYEITDNVKSNFSKDYIILKNNSKRIDFTLSDNILSFKVDKFQDSSIEIQVKDDFNNRAVLKNSVQKSEEFSAKLFVYPNPFYEKLTIQINCNKSFEGELILYNSVGKKVDTIYEGEMDNGKNVFEFEPFIKNLENFSNGIYYLILKKDNNKIKYRKVLYLK